jgi:hypothetical protein
MFKRKMAYMEGRHEKEVRGRRRPQLAANNKSTVCGQLATLRQRIMQLEHAASRNPAPGSLGPRGKKTTPAPAVTENLAAGFDAAW